MQELLNSSYRLSILRALEASSGYSANDSVIQMIMEQYGNDLSHDQLRTQLYWLQEQGVIKLETVGNYIVATLTQRGDDVVRGLAKVPGIKKPRPGI